MTRFESKYALLFIIVVLSLRSTNSLATDSDVRLDAILKSNDVYWSRIEHVKLVHHRTTFGADAKPLWRSEGNYSERYKITCRNIDKFSGRQDEEGDKHSDEILSDYFYDGTSSYCLQYPSKNSSFDKISLCEPGLLKSRSRIIRYRKDIDYFFPVTLQYHFVVAENGGKTLSYLVGKYGGKLSESFLNKDGEKIHRITLEQNPSMNPHFSFWKLQADINENKGFLVEKTTCYSESAKEKVAMVTETEIAQFHQVSPGFFFRKSSVHYHITEIRKSRIKRRSSTTRSRSTARRRSV